MAVGAHAESAGPVLESFSQGGHQVRVETYAPAGAGRHPSVILLHGADNVEPHAAAYRASAQELARNGYVTLLVHYFDATGTRSADEDSIARNFLDWMETAAQAVSFAAEKNNVQPDRIGLTGFSLGASLALSLASQDSRIGAVVEFYGTLPDLAAAFLKRMPPVLILHGAADALVPATEAYKLERLLESKGVPFEMKIYPGQGHGFTAAATADAATRAVAFFNRFLKAPPKAAGTCVGRPILAAAAFPPGSAPERRQRLPACPAEPARFLQ
jgi:carboxymethylenebutenolidase